MPLHPKTPLSLASFKFRLDLPFWYRLTQVVLEKRPLNGCSSSLASLFWPDSMKILLGNDTLWQAIFHVCLKAGRSQFNLLHWTNNQKKWQLSKVCGVGFEIGRETTTGRICEKCRFWAGNKLLTLFTVLNLWLEYLMICMCMCMYREHQAGCLQWRCNWVALAWHRQRSVQLRNR